MLVFSVTMPSPHPTEYKPSSRAQHISAKRTAGAQASCRSLRISGFTHERLTVNMRPEIYSSVQCPVAKHSMCSTAPQCQNVCWQVREREGVLPPAIFPALAAFQQHTALQKMQAGLLTSASLLCSCRQTYALIFYFSFFFLNEFGQSFQ